METNRTIISVSINILYHVPFSSTQLERRECEGEKELDRQRKTGYFFFKVCSRNKKGTGCTELNRLAEVRTACTGKLKKGSRLGEKIEKSNARETHAQQKHRAAIMKHRILNH